MQHLQAYTAMNDLPQVSTFWPAAGIRPAQQCGYSPENRAWLCCGRAALPFAWPPCPPSTPCPAPSLHAPLRRVQDLRDSMLSHLKLHFNNASRNDESVLGAYPSTIRRRVLRHLYLDILQVGGWVAAWLAA